MNAPVVGVTGHSDPEGESPWALQAAFLVDKAAPPAVSSVCEAVARATVLLLDDPRSRSGEWSGQVQRWNDGRIRKVVRRARPAHFERAEHVPGMSLTHRGAVVRVFVPAPVDQVHPDIRRLQVSGTELPDLGTPSEDAFLTLALNPALEMSTGKKAAQCAHGAQLAWMHMEEGALAAWRDSSFSLRVLHPEASQWEQLLLQAQERVVDAGFTEIPAGSNTVLALY